MRFTRSLIIAALLTVPSTLLAQQAASTANQPEAVFPDVGSSNFIDVGWRGTGFSSGSDEARFQRYRDLRNGPTADAFRFFNENDSRQIKVQAEHVGYRDQRYYGSYNGFGKMRISIEWNQTPIFFSQDTRSLFTSPSDGVFLIDDGIQSGIQNKTTTLAAAVGQAHPIDLRARRDVFDFRLRYSATPNLDWNLAIKNTHKTGNQPWAGTFGFSDAVELPVPLDTRATELGTSVEWSNSRGLARVGYDGSFFRNQISTLTWDNPLRSTDSTLGPVFGRMALWPNSDLNAVNATGAVNLPARSHATAYLSVGNWSQNQALIPFTINSALASIPLDRQTADAKARVTSMALAFNSRPTDMVWVSARYRSYDFDNQTPIFHVANTVAYDTSVAVFADGGTSPYSFNRKIFDADASITPVSFLALRAGYTREQVDQTFRQFDSTTENTLRTSADLTGIGWLTVRAVYEHGKRVGSGLDEQVLDDIGEQVSLRQFDISDRTSDRFSAIVQVMPVSSFSISGTASAGKEDRPDVAFGLRSNTNHAYSVGVDYVPREAISVGISYEYEKYDALQNSRQANPGVQFNDPTRDWTTDGSDKARTVTAGLDLLKLWPRTDVRVAYNYSHAESVYVYGLAANSTLPPVVQLTPVVNEFNRVTADVRYYLTKRVAIGGVYLFDKYKVDDFALGPQTLNTLAPPSFLILGYTYRPYTANTVMGRLTYFW